ncbi:8-oxoguanine glycosylase ogg1 [Linnemannia zychae]|nr:8-oxoguanine glycosylase ogg1 [Linnemannia zychae]
MLTTLTRTTRKRALTAAKDSSISTVTGSVATTRTTTRTKATAKASKSSSTKSTPPSLSASYPRINHQPPLQVQSTPWVSIQVPRSELDLGTTLKCGQSFRWQREHQELPSGEISAPTWSCVLDKRVWFLQETEDGFRFRTVRPFAPSVSSSSTSTTTKGIKSNSEVTLEPLGKDDQKDMEKIDKAFLRDYFQLDIPLTELYAKWSATDKNFKAKAPFFPGVRILRQDPVENLFCFICSSNNNISRITQMASKLCSEYGAPLLVPSDENSIDNSTSRTFYEFPTIDALAQDDVEETLRRLGFGYRAKYIATTAKMIQQMENGMAWLYGLRKGSYEDARASLLTLQGVGPKVADCICLMSLDKHGTIPVDTHVWQIALRDYKFRFEGKVPKTISSAVYKAVGQHFVDLFGSYAGWAHNVLFAADLRTIEGRVKEDPDVVKLEEEEVSMKIVVKAEEKEEEETAKVEEHIREIKLEEELEVTTGRRSSKRRRGV